MADIKGGSGDPNTALKDAIDKLTTELSGLKDQVAEEVRGLKDQVASALGGVAALQVSSVDVKAREKILATPSSPDAHGVVAKSLRITSKIRADELASAAQKDVAKKYKNGRENAQAFIQSKKLESTVAKLTASLNGSGTLDDTTRLLLSHPDVYGTVVLGILKKAEADGALSQLGQDKEGFRLAVLAALEEEKDGPVRAFMIELAHKSLRRGGVIFDPKQPQGARLVEQLSVERPPLTEGRLESAIENAYERILLDGDFPMLVDAYIGTKEVDSNRFTAKVRSGMVRHLIERGVTINLKDVEQKKRFLEGGYDEYFAVAYEQAMASASSNGDPIVAASTKGGTVPPWDFTVDTFESIEEQGIVKENILAAGALDYIYELGERLGIYRLVDALTLNWAAGAIDVVDGPCAAKLYRYWKLRDQRMDPSERGLVYRRVLNKGETEALDRMVVNDSFEALWGTLCEKVAEYRAKVEDAKVEEGDQLLVSRTPLYQAVRDLQHNLTEFSTGMAHMQVREMYSQLHEAMELLGDPEIVDHFAGGRRKTMWTVIERLAKSEYGEAPNINAIRIAAVEGNVVFRFIANFQPGAVAEEDFQRFIDAAEAWIIAKGSDDSALAPEPEEEEDDEVDEDEERDDFPAEEI